jgi:hypothetical protein
MTPLFHDNTNTMITMWDAMEYAIHTHYTQLFLKLQFEFQTNCMNLKSIHILMFGNCYFEMKNLYFSFEYFYLDMKVYISILKIIISI